MAGLLIARKCALNVAAGGTVGQLSEGVQWAATVEPPFAQRKLKYRRTPGIGAFAISVLDPHAAQRLHRIDALPTEALRIELFGSSAVDVLISTPGEGTATAWFKGYDQDDHCYNAIVATYPWADALATRTVERLAAQGISSSVDTISLRSW